MPDKLHIWTRKVRLADVYKLHLDMVHQYIWGYGTRSISVWATRRATPILPLLGPNQHNTNNLPPLLKFHAAVGPISAKTRSLCCLTTYQILVTCWRQCGQLYKSHFPGQATQVQMTVCSFQIQVIVVIFNSFVSEKEYSRWCFTICIY